MKHWNALFCLVLPLALTSPARAAGFIISNDVESQAPWPRPLPPRPTPPVHPVPPPMIPPWERSFRFAPLEIKALNVQSRVKDQFATTKIEQEFYNPNSRVIEGTFLFPLPRGAQIDKFTMQIGGEFVEAELLDAEKARKLYEDIVRKAKDPALLEYAGRDLLKARIFPIEPNTTKRVTLSYSQLLKRDSGVVSYVFPLDAAKYAVKPLEKLNLTVELEAGRPLKSIYSPSHSVRIDRSGPSQAKISYEATGERPGAEFQLLYGEEDDELGFSLLTHRKGTEDGYFLLLASPGFETKNRHVLPKDLAFVLDTSGSMAGAKLEQAKKALLFCIENLNERDQFDVIRFATETEPLFDKLTESTPETRRQASDFVRGLKPIGGTAIDDALRKALRMREGKAERPFIIIFLTDGRPTVGTTEEDKIVANVISRGAEANHTGTRIFCFGIGTDVNTHLLDRITEKTRAVSQYVLPEEDIEVKVSTFFSKIKEPVLAELKLNVEGPVRFSRTYPSELPDLFQGEQLVVAGRYAGSGKVNLSLQGSAENQVKRFVHSFELPASASDREFIPRLWASRRIGYLLDEIRLRGENQELREEVIALARQFGVVTPYTAYLILEDETRRNVPLHVQSLPRLNEDSSARQLALDYFRSANQERTGDAAVAAARYGLALKQADNLQSFSLGAQEARRGLAATALRAAPGSPLPAQIAAGRITSANRLGEYSQQSQFVNGRNFFLNGKQWIDATVQNLTNAPRTRIEFNSAEYFALLAEQPETAGWLALGPNVQFAAKGRVIEITAEAQP